jgi:hypothetical protein
MHNYSYSHNIKGEDNDELLKLWKEAEDYILKQALFN